MVMIRRLAKKGVDKIERNILHQKLLPELTFQKMTAISSAEDPPSASHFQAVSQELTQSMLNFHENVNLQQ